MTSWLLNFPNINLNIAEPIDEFVRYININYGEVFVAAKKMLSIFINGHQRRTGYDSLVADDSAGSFCHKKLMN